MLGGAHRKPKKSDKSIAEGHIHRREKSESGALVAEVLWRKLLSSRK